jgi:hypothetical protein
MPPHTRCHSAPLFAALIVSAVTSDAAATIYVSDEAYGNNPLGRAAASTLDDGWRSLVAGASPLTYFERPDVLADEATQTPPPYQGTMDFPTVGLTVNYSFRRMDGPSFGTLATGAQPIYSNDVGDPAWGPNPDELQLTPGGEVFYTDVFSGVQSTDHRSAVLFEFSKSIRNFGLFVSDLESRPFGRLARLRLFDSAGNRLTGDIDCATSRECLVPTGVVLGESSYTYDVNSQANSTDVSGKWGNNTTQFVGFYNEPLPVSKALLIVGDEDFGGQGFTEHIVFLGATTVGAIPELEGDHDGDGVISSDDANLWKTQYGLVVAEPGAASDSNGDGVVDAADYTVWRDAYDATASSTAIPEPTAIVLGLAAITIVLTIRSP